MPIGQCQRCGAPVDKNEALCYQCALRKVHKTFAKEPNVDVPNSQLIRLCVVCWEWFATELGKCPHCEYKRRSIERSRSEFNRG